MRTVHVCCIFIAYFHSRELFSGLAKAWIHLPISCTFVHICAYICIFLNCMFVHIYCIFAHRIVFLMHFSGTVVHIYIFLHIQCLFNTYFMHISCIFLHIISLFIAYFFAYLLHMYCTGIFHAYARIFLHIFSILMETHAYNLYSFFLHTSCTFLLLQSESRIVLNIHSICIAYCLQI